MEAIAEAANSVARRTLLDRYKQGKSNETLRRHECDIALFEEYLENAHHFTKGMKDDLSLWQGMSYGIASGFQQWQLQSGYSISSVNARTTTIKKYCKLAHQAGYVSDKEAIAIKEIRGISFKEGRNIDENREVHRIGRKKSQTVLLYESHVQLIKKKLYEDSRTDQSKARDYLLFCLLVDHGLRCGEVADLETKNLDTTTGTLVFYRRKVHKTQTHNLTSDTFEAAEVYLKMAMPGEKLFRGNAHKTHEKTSEDGLTTRAINKIIAKLGNLVGKQGLSPHDLRHYWATAATRKGTDIKSLQQAGGWNSPYMPLRYAEESAIANEGVKL
jgi:integrase